MVYFWTLVTVVPLLAFGLGAAFRPARTRALAERFFASRRAALLLTVAGWFWTAWECHRIGIDVFDAVLKVFPGQLWVMAAGLSYLTYVWMPANLPCRALMGLFMLMPAQAFRTTRLLVPASGFAPVHLLVAVIYLYAVVGMYGMFYPWRIEKAVKWLCARKS